MPDIFSEERVTVSKGFLLQLRDMLVEFGGPYPEYRDQYKWDNEGGDQREKLEAYELIKKIESIVR